MTKTKLNDMTTQEIYKLASELTEKEINNVLAGWENTNEAESLETFDVLVSLGDSRGLALATTIAKKYKGEKDNSTYILAYES
jgi:hypothetical protein